MDATVKQRLIYVDRLKGFAIFLVVLGHVIQYNSLDFTSNKLFAAIYSFHMPLFFFISGYIAEKMTDNIGFRAYGGFIGKKSMALLLPLFSWPLVTSYLFSVDRNVADIPNILVRQIVTPDLWFLHSLFLIFLIYGVVRVLQDRQAENVRSSAQIMFHGLALAACFGFSKVFPDLNALPYIMNYGFFSMGTMLARREGLANFVMDKWVHLVAVVSFVFLVAYFQFDQLVFLKMKLLKSIVSVVAIASLYVVARKIVLPDSIEKWLSVLSSSSLVIYVTHFMFAHLVPKGMIGALDLEISAMIVVLLPITVYIIVLCLVVERVVRTCPILELLLYGRWVKKVANFKRN